MTAGEHSPEQLPVRGSEGVEAGVVAAVFGLAPAQGVERGDSLAF